jgi:arylsulfatase A-like enzyme
MADSPIFQVQCAARSAQFRRDWSEQTYKELIAAYYGQVAMIDHSVGQILDALHQEGLWDNTLVVFCSDHGDHNGAYGLFFKGQMYDSCCKVPLLIKPPRSAGGGTVRQEIVNTLDLYGTLLDAAGDTSWQQPHIEARSLTPLLEPGDADWDNKTYSIIGRDPSRSLTMLRRDDLKLMRLGRGEEEPLYELYDMNDEIVEAHNVFDDPSYCDIKGVLRAELDAWSRQQAAKYPDEITSYTKA